MNWLKRAAAKAGSLLDKYYHSVPVYRLNRTDKLIGVVTAAFFFVLYLLTCSHGPNIAGDAPELIAGSYSLGILHPPGYPLYTMLGYAFSHIPIGSIAFRVNLLSVVAHTLTLFLLFITLMKITRNRVASIVSVAILGFSSLFWFYSLIAEVFSLSTLFAVLLILVAILVRDRWVSGNRTGSEKLFLFFAFLCGLSLTHHHTILLIYPALLLFILHPLIAVIKKPKRLVSAILLFVLGLVPYIYIPLRASQNPYMNFANPSSFDSLFKTVTRQYYGSTRLWLGPEATNRLDVIFNYFQTLDTQVYMVGMIVGVLGIFRMAKKRVGDFVPLITALFFTAIIFPWMANVEIAGIFERSTIERFYMLPTILFMYFVAMGFAFIFNWIKKWVSRIEMKEKEFRLVLVILSLLLFVFIIVLPFLLIEKAYFSPTIIMVYFPALLAVVLISWILISRIETKDELKRKFVLFAILIITLIIILPFVMPAHQTAELVSLREDCFGEAYVHNVLQSVEDGAILYLAGDVPIELIDMYQKLVDEDPRDIILITNTFWTSPWYMEHLRIWYPDLELPDVDDVTYSGVKRYESFKAAFLEYIMQTNPQVTSLYTIAKDPNVERFYDLMPYGFVYKAYPKGEELDFDRYYQFFEEFQENLDWCGIDYSEYTDNRRELYTIMETSLYLADAARIFEENGRLVEAQQLYSFAHSIFPSEDFQREAAYAFLEMGQPESAYALLQDYLDKGSAFDPNVWRAMLELENVLREAGVE